MCQKELIFALLNFTFYVITFKIETFWIYHSVYSHTAFQAKIYLIRIYGVVKYEHKLERSKNHLFEG